MENKIKGFKVTDANLMCRDFKFELNTEYVQKGKIKACNNGFHFCVELKDCFNYYSFDPNNRVFEVEGYGSLDTEGDKICSEKIILLKEISWIEVLTLVNLGKCNTGIGNAGNDNAGNDNAGNYNAGNYNAGNRNAGNRNAGYSNAGNDNAGAFNNLSSPNYMLFNKPSNWTYEDFKSSKVFNLLHQIDTTLWIPDYKMTEQEKKDYPYFNTTGGYVKNIDYKEAFINSWNNWNESSRQAFKDLPNFDSEVFFDITGVKV